MTPKQLHNTNEHYSNMFGCGMSQPTLQLLSATDTVEELDEIEDQLSAGEFDAAEAIIEGR